MISRNLISPIHKRSAPGAPLFLSESSEVSEKSESSEVSESSELSEASEASELSFTTIPLALIYVKYRTFMLLFKNFA